MKSGILQNAHMIQTATEGNGFAFLQKKKRILIKSGILQDAHIIQSAIEKLFLHFCKKREKNSYKNWKFSKMHHIIQSAIERIVSPKCTHDNTKCN